MDNLSNKELKFCVYKNVMLIYFLLPKNIFLIKFVKVFYKKKYNMMKIGFTIIDTFQ